MTNKQPLNSSRTTRHIVIAIALLILLILLAPDIIDTLKFEKKTTWNKDEITRLNTLHIQNNPKNKTPIDEPLATLGQLLFFDKDLSSNSNVSCASCHDPETYFTDATRFPMNGVGSSTTNTPTIVGASNSNWFFSDGRKDSLWSQALGPLENTEEHGSNRMRIIKTVLQKYKTRYEKLFGKTPEFGNENHFPDDATPQGNNNKWISNWEKMSESDKTLANQAFANIGHSIAEYEKHIQPGISNFDKFVSDLKHSNTSESISQEAQFGVKLYLDETTTGCINCHNGPLFSNHSFQATGISDDDNNKTNISNGRLTGIAIALTDEFNCYSIYGQADCSELKYAKREGVELQSAFKVPTLRNISNTAPYMHNGSLETLKSVLSYYNTARAKPGRHIELRPLRLFPHKLKQLRAFLHTLSAPVAADSHWLINPHLRDR